MSPDLAAFEHLSRGIVQYDIHPVSLQAGGGFDANTITMPIH